MLKRILVFAISLFPLQAVAAKENDKQCMASAIYYEAGNQSDVGKRAVMDVILNRVKKTGKSICKVISSPGQFTWYGKKPLKVYNDKMKGLLKRMDEVGKVLIDENYLFFFDKSLKPKWARKMECLEIESHLFCRLENA